MVKKIIVRDTLTLKKGKSQYGEWILTKVTDTEGKEYTTFDSLFSGLESGTEVLVSIDPNGEYQGKPRFQIKAVHCLNCPIHCGQEAEEASAAADKVNSTSAGISF